MSERRLKGRYEPLSVLGRGLATTTHLALDHETGERCVVKLLRLSAEDALKAHELLTREARVLQRLDHPRIPRLVDFFSEEDGADTRVCLVQQHVDGRSLERRVREAAPLGEREALALGIELCHVLEYLHGFEPPILHRDLKPANVIVTPTERVYLVDFGAVRDHLPHEMLHPSGPTIVGTRGYMPIEQFEGRAVPGSDLYALGATLVFALSGKEPSQLGKAGLRLAIEPHVAVSPGLAKLLARLLEPDWRERPFSAREVREELERLSEQALRPRPRPRATKPWLVALVAVAVAIAFFATRRTRPAGPAGSAAMTSSPGVAEAPEPGVGVPRPPASAWHGWTATGRDPLGDPAPPGALRRLGTARLRHGAPVLGLAFTPDGQTIVSAAEDATASLWSARTGEERSRLALGSKAAGLALSPDGTRLLVGEASHWTARLFALPDGRPVARLLPASPRSGARAEIVAVAWSRDGRSCATRTEDAIDLRAQADGRHLARLPGCGYGRGLSFVARDRELLVGCRDGASLLDASTGAELRRLKAPGSGQPLIVAPDVSLLAAVQHSQVALFQLATGGAAFVLDDDELRASAVSAVAFAPDGRRLAAGLWSGKVVLFDLAARARSQVLEGALGGVTALAFAPDGRTLAVGAGHGVSLFDLASAKPLAAAPAHQGAVRDLEFSGDGELLSAGADGTIRRWEGGGGSRVLVAFERPATAVATLSAERLVAVEEGRAHLHDAATGWEVTSVPLVRTPHSAVAVAPRAGLLAAGGASSLQIVDVASGGRRSFPVPRAEEALAFSPDGRVVATLRAEAAPLAGRPLVLRDAASGRELRQLAHSRGGPGPFRCRSSDGSYFGFDGVVYRLGGARGPFDYVGTVGRVLHCAVSPDGRRVALVGVDDPDVVDLSELAPTTSGRTELSRRGARRGHRGPVTALSFAPDSRTLASGGADTAVLLWDALAPAPASPAAARPPRREPIVRLSFDDETGGVAGLAPLRLGPDAPFAFVPGFRGRALAPRIGLAFPELRALPIGDAFTLLAAFRVEAAGPPAGSPHILLETRLATLDVRDGGAVRLFLHYQRGGHTQVDLAPWIGKVAPGRWYHVALSVERASGAARVCVDGVCGAGPPWRDFHDRVGELTLARSAPYQPFAGAIDEVAIHDRALSDDEMAAAAGLARAVPLPSPTPRPTPTPLPRLPAEQEPLPREGLPEGQDVTHHVAVEEKAGFTVYRFGGPLARAQTLDVDVGLGAVWVGTSLGLLRHDPRGGSFRLWDETAGLPGARLDEIAVVGGRVIADSSTPTTPGNVRGTGVLAFEVARLAWTTLKDVGGAWDLWGDGSTLWVGTGRGAEMRDLETGALRRFTRAAGELVHDSLHAVRRHGDTVAFAAMGDYVKETKDFTGGGLTLWDRRADRFRSYTPREGLARGYSCDVFLDDDEVFVAHWDEERGLSRIDRRTGRVEAWPRSKNGVELGGVVLAGDRGTLWIGQQGALVRLDRATRQATALRETDGLPGYIVSGVVVGEGAVWASVYAYGGDGVRSAGLVRLRR